MRFIRRLSLEANHIVIYPVYSVLFTSLSGWYQVALLFLLPAVKYVAKRLVKRPTADYEDLVPAIAVTVDLFNALYQSKCMQKSGSLVATAGIIVINLVQNILSLYTLFPTIRVLKALLSAEQLMKGVVGPALEIASQPAQVNMKELLGIRVASCAHFRLSEKHAAMAERFLEIQGEARRHRRQQHRQVAKEAVSATGSFFRVLSAATDSELCLSLSRLDRRVLLPRLRHHRRRTRT